MCCVMQEILKMNRDNLKSIITKINTCLSLLNTILCMFLQQFQKWFFLLFHIERNRLVNVSPNKVKHNKELFILNQTYKILNKCIL